MLLRYESISPGVTKIYSESNLRSAILDIGCMSVYFFQANRRIIATDELMATAIYAMRLCIDWVENGKYFESDFARRESV